MFKLTLLATLTLTISACGNGMKAVANTQEGPSTNGGDPTAVLTLGALGDSITRGMDIRAYGLESPEQSWSTGATLSTSIGNRLAGHFGADYSVHTVNAAVSGSTVLGSNSKFQAKAQELAASSPHIVTIEIGSNDVCDGLVTGNGATQMRDKVITALNTLVNAPSPPQIIVVASIPHIYSLTQIPGFSTNNVCVTAWNLMCQNLQIGQAAFDAQWTAANQALADAAAAVGGPVVFDNGAVANASFAAADVSTLDCFHPSVQGQAKLAGLIWPVVQSRLSP